MKTRNFFVAMALGIGITTAAWEAKAWNYTLTDNNAQVKIGADDGFGMSDWCTDGVNHLFRQDFFYRVGSGAHTFEKSITTLPLLNAWEIGANGLAVVYGNNNFTLEINYLLTGGPAGNGASTISEQIKITNISGYALDFHFFQFVDFDLAESNLGDQLYLVQNLEGLFTGAYQQKGTSYFAEEVVTPGANRAQADEVWPDWPLVDSLNDGSPTTLNNNAGPVSGDTAWAFQWDTTLAVDECFEISILKSVHTTPVPEPSVLALVSLMGAGLVARKRFTARK